jgi:dephospho-CoA kinase
LPWLWYNPAMKYVIGLTGNIGSGKSTVLRMLEQLGARIIDADALVREVMAEGTPVWQAIVETFGEGVLDQQGEIDRSGLGSLVFNDRDALTRLEAIVHPAVHERFTEIVRNSEEHVVAVEAVKLIESGVHQEMSSLWLVTCPAEERLRRLVESRGISPEEIEDRLRAQMPEEQQAQWADVVIDNAGSLENTREQVEAEWEKIREKQCRCQ